MAVSQIEAKLAEAGSGRAVHVFALPKRAQVTKPNGQALPKKVGIRALTAGEEEESHKLGGTNFMRAQYEAVKRSIVELDGKAVGNSEGEVDRYWDECGAIARSLIMQAWQRVSAPTKQEEDDFFKSETVKVA